MICEYGCGQKAIYQFKNGKWCCSENIASCNFIRKNNTNRSVNLCNNLKTKYNWIFDIEDIIENTKNLREVKVRCKNPYCKNSKEHNGWFIPTRSQLNERLRSLKTNKENSFFYCCIECKNKYFNLGYGKLLSKKRYKFLKGDLNPMRCNNPFNKLTINKIKIKYPIFSKVEEMRYNPDKPGEKEIQVHCKNHNCENSKEQNGWFTPTGIQLAERLRCINHGNGGSYFYCCEECKQECPLYNLRSDPNKEIKLNYTPDEYQTFRQEVLNRETFKCEYCGEPANTVHHSRPQKLEPFYSLDPDFGIACCQDCHYKYGHKDECSTGKIASKICS